MLDKADIHNDRGSSSLSELFPNILDMIDIHEAGSVYAAVCAFNKAVDAGASEDEAVDAASEAAKKHRFGCDMKLDQI